MSKNKKILFIDDDVDFLQAQSTFLTGRGYVVLTAASADEAMKVLAANTPDFIFLDLMMENYDSGFRLSHKIRSDERFQKTPLVMLSGVAATAGRRFDQEQESLKNWCQLDGFIDKPVSGKQLLDLIEKRTSTS